MSFDAAPGDTTRMEFLVRQTPAFFSDYWKESCYRSIPFGVEVFTGGKVFWLAGQVIP